MRRDNEGNKPAHIVLRGVTKRFSRGQDDIDVLRGVDLEIQHGETVSVIGRSGAGKSTLLHILGALDRPTSGDVFINGESLFGRKDRGLAEYRGREVGFIFQFHHLLPEFSSLENAAMPALIARVPKEEAFARATKLLERVDLGPRLHPLPTELSGGEQQRVALARALIMKPAIILADEPTGNLDEALGQEIFEFFQEINREMNVTIVVVTHHLGLAESMSRQLVMEKGLLIDIKDANPTAGEGA